MPNLIVMSEDDYVNANGGSRFAIDHGLVGGQGYMSDRARRSALKRQEELAAERNAARECARVEYHQLVETGAMQPPTLIERMIERARRHPDNEATRAARRVLERRGIEWREVRDIAVGILEGTGG